MKLEQQKSDGRWIFTGTIPMELARKSWPDRYAAVRSAEAVGVVCLANGKCMTDGEYQRMKSDDGLGSRAKPQ